MPDGDYLLAGMGGGLRGLIEAYKAKMENDTERAKIQQSGFNSIDQQRREDPLAQKKFDLAELRAHNTETYQKGMLAAMTGGMPGAEVDPGIESQADAVLGKQIAPERVPSGFRGANAVSVLKRVLQKNPKANLNTLTTEAQAERFGGGPVAQRIERSASALGPLLADLKTQIGYDPATGALTGKTPLGRFPVVNKLKAWGAGQTGSDTYTGINANVAAIQKELNMMAASGGSDKNLALAAEMIQPGAAPAQILKGIQAVERLAGGRAQAYTGTNPFGGAGGGADEDPMGLFK